MRTTSPSRAPARASAARRPCARSRCCTYAIASGLVRSAMATTRSARAPVHAPRAVVVAHDREAFLRRAQHHERLGLGLLGRAPRRSSVPSRPRNSSSPARVTAEIVGSRASNVRRASSSVGDVGLAARRRAAAARAARAGSGRARRAAPAPARPAARRRPARGRAASRAPAPARCGGGTGARGRAPRPRPR